MDLQDSVAYKVTVKAANDVGDGEPSWPELGDWPWVPVKPGTPRPAAVTAAPRVVEIRNGEVELAVDAGDTGGAVPPGSFECTTTSQGGPVGSSQSEKSIVVSGLDPAEAYTFTCSFANALAGVDGASSRSTASPATVEVRPFVPPPPAPVLERAAAEGSALALRVDLRVAETRQASAECCLVPTTGSALAAPCRSGSLETDGQGNMTGSVQAPFPARYIVFLCICQRRNKKTRYFASSLVL